MIISVNDYFHNFINNQLCVLFFSSLKVGWSSNYSTIRSVKAVLTGQSAEESNSSSVPKLPLFLNVGVNYFDKIIACRFALISASCPKLF